MLRLLAACARGRWRPAAASTARLGSRKVEIQGLIESSKFEPDARDLVALQKATGEAQIVFLLLLSRARHPRRVELDSAVVETLEAVAVRVAGGLASAVPDIRGALGDENSPDVYRPLMAALGRLSSWAPATSPASHARPATTPALLHQ
jgi:hypothetical protein